MHRLLIADSDEVFLAAAIQAFSADFEVMTCRDGETALELLAEYQPQALILNLLLPFKDGMTVLQEAAALPPVIIATTPIILPHIEQACLDKTIQYLMINPRMNALRVQTVQMVNRWESQQPLPDLQAQVRLHLHILNFQTYRTGYRQLCEAIPIYFRDRDICLDTALYTQIAKTFQKSGSKTVERAMRAVIVQAWENRDVTVWRKYLSDPDDCPSNKVFFDAISNHLREP